MYRDFSSKSKQNMLNLVSQVENEKWSDFTDWVGDRWLDFQGWIGKLNIENSINNVNEYHKKVIDKNNVTSRKIEQIFKEVSLVDKQYKLCFSIAEDFLQQWKKYIEHMTEIVDPRNGKFNAHCMNESLGNLPKLNTGYPIIYTMPLYRIIDNSKEQDYDIWKEKLGADLLKLFSKLTKDDKKAEYKLWSSNLSYFTGLYTFLAADYNSPSELAVGGLKLTKSSASAWNGIYKYYDTKLKPLEASRLSKKFGKLNNCVSILGSLCGFSADSINMIKTLLDEEADIYQKTDQVLNEVSSGFDVGSSIINVKLGQKHLGRTVTAKYEWRTSYADEKLLKKAGTVVDLADVTIDTFRGYISRYGQVTADGNFTSEEMGEVGVYGSVRGLTSIVSKATFGISDIVGLSDHADDISAGIVNFANTTGTDYVLKHEFSTAYVQSVQGMMDYANNEDNNVIGRVAVSAVAGTGMIAAIAIDGIGDVCSAIGTGISEGWKNLFG